MNGINNKSYAFPRVRPTTQMFLRREAIEFVTSMALDMFAQHSRVLHGFHRATPRRVSRPRDFKIDANRRAFQQLRPISIPMSRLTENGARTKRNIFVAN